MRAGRQGDVGITGGQVTVGWTDIAANEHQLMVNSIPPGRDFRFNGTTGFINFGTTTDFTSSVQVPLNQISCSGYVDFDRGHCDSNDAMLGLKLIAPDGEYIYSFHKPKLTSRRNSITVRGITGANVGENNGFLVGTTFTDAAARSIVDLTPTGGRGASAPYIGDFRIENDGFVTDPDGRTLTAFLNKVLSNGAINGTWKLETIDTTTSAADHAGERGLLDFEFEHRHEAGSRRAGAWNTWPHCCRFFDQHVPDSIGCFASRDQSGHRHGLR